MAIKLSFVFQATLVSLLDETFLFVTSFYERFGKGHPLYSNLRSAWGLDYTDALHRRREALMQSNLIIQSSGRPAGGQAFEL